MQKIKIMKKTGTLLLFTLLINTTKIQAQAKYLQGTITDKNNNTIENATITIIESNTTTTTNAFGNFTFNNLNENTKTIDISCIGYSNKRITLNTNDSSNVKIILDKLGLTLNNITVKSTTVNNYNKIAEIDFKLRPINTAQDILKNVPGLFIAQHAGGGKAEQIFLRGFDIDHGTDINIMVDGMPVNMISHAHGQGYADLHFLNPETIDKINFDKGPYNAEKGNLSTAGFVDFKTKNFLDNNSIKIEAGKFNMQRISGLVKLYNVNNSKKKEQLYIASEFVKNDGYFESPQNFKRLNLMAKYSLVKNNNYMLNILLSTFTSKWNASGQIPERAVLDKTINRFGSIDNTEAGNTSRTNFSIQFAKQLKNNVDFSQQAYYSNYNFNLFSNFTFFLNNPIDGDMINQKEKRDIFGYQVKIKKENTVLKRKATTTAGIGFRYDNISDIGLANAPKRIITNYVQRGKIKETNVFAYLNETVQINKKLTANASIRLDNFNFGYKDLVQLDSKFKFQNKSILIPKLNLNYNLSKKVNLFVSNGIGFHSNDTRVILADSADKILPKVYGTDIGFTIKPTKNLFIKTIFWHLFSEQEFVYVGDAGVVEPSGKTRRIGIDFITRYQPTKWLFADIDISIAKPSALGNKKGENYVPLAPTLTSVGGITAKLNNTFNAALRYRFMSNRPANEDYSLVAKGYLLADAVLNFKRKNIEYSLTAENIFNQKWKEAQFETTTRLQNEADAVTEIHYTPGTPFFIKAGISISF
jgi:TonB-dependent Receptor Plug Domain/CarboxypepD_reg-like domain